MNDWEKFNETLLPEKDDFYNHLNMEDITDAGYAHTKKVCKKSEMKNLVEYLYLRILKMLLEMYELDPGKFISVPGLAWQAALKKTKVKLDL